jgi:dihydrofolate reductase
MGHPILMGRKTYESIGKALPGRRNLVMSRSAQFAPADASVVVNLPAALEAAVDAPVLMVIGGSEIYAQTLPHAQRIHLTLVHTQIDGGEAFFRGWRGPQFRQADLEYHTADERHAYPFSFITLERS